MIKRNKILFVVILSVCMLLFGQIDLKTVYAIRVPAISNEMTGGEMLEKKYSEKMSDQEKKEMSASQMISPEKEEAILSLSDEFGTMDMKSKNSKNYAGVYLNSDNEIVVEVTNKNASILQKIEKSLDGEDAKVKVAEYSLNQLKEQMKLIEDFYEKNYSKTSGEEKDILDSIKAFYIDVEKNAVVIRIKNNNARKEKYMKDNVGGNVTLLFENTEYDNKEVTNLSAGQGIAVDLQNGYCSLCSIGFRVWWPNSSGNLEFGFITCGHGIEIGQAVYTSNHFSSSNRIGYVCNKKYGDNVDASVVLIQNYSYNLTNNIYGTSSYLTDRYYFPSLIQGMGVWKVGQTTGNTYGTVTTPTISVTTEDGMTINDCFETTNHAEAGDSGGIAYSYDTSSNVICIDGITRSTNGTYSHFVKYMNTYYAFGTNAY